MEWDYSGRKERVDKRRKQAKPTRERKRKKEQKIK